LWLVLHADPLTGIFKARNEHNQSTKALMGGGLLNLKHLQSFVVVAQEKSFTKAARLLYMTQPAISWQIKSLETQLGCQLLERKERTVELTEAGRVVLENARHMVALYSETIQALEEIRGLKRGTLVVGASTIPGEYLLPKIAGHFAAEYPGIHLKLLVADTATVAQWLLEDMVHLGIVGARPQDSELIEEPLFEDKIILLASPQHPLGQKEQAELEECLKFPWIMREKGSGTRQSVENALSNRGLDPDLLPVGMELGSTRAALTAARAGFGLTWASLLAATDDLTLGHLAEVKVNLEVKRNLYLVQRRERYLSPPVNAFIAFLQKEARS